MEGVIARDDPSADDVQALLAAHHAFANANTPPEHIHALDGSGLLDPAISFFSFRRNGELLGIGALKRLDADHAELKSMHTAAGARGHGVGRAMVDHLVRVARADGFLRVSLETGTGTAFEPAHALYTKAGFVPCEPFAGYSPSPSNTFMTLSLNDDASRRRPATDAD